MDVAGPQLRVKQIYAGYLTSVYNADYFRCVRERTRSYSTHLDFAIGVGAAASGSAGAGVALLSRPELIFVPPIIAGAATVLSIAKGVYNWPDRFQKAMELEQYYDQVSSEFNHLVEDIQVALGLNDDLNRRYAELRSKSARPPHAFIYTGLSLRKQRELQDAIKARIPYKGWWLPAGVTHDA